MPIVQADPKRVESGIHFTLGNYALVEGAITAGCDFFGGYPITPANEISEMMSKRLPQVGGKFMQGEDELCSIYACAGARARRCQGDDRHSQRRIQLYAGRARLLLHGGGSGCHRRTCSAAAEKLCVSGRCHADAVGRLPATMRRLSSAGFGAGALRLHHLGL